MIHNKDSSCNVQNYSGTISTRCPQCKHIGNFDSFAGSNDICSVKRTERGQVESVWFLGHRFCPSQKCRAHLFFIVNSDGSLLTTYPPTRLDFNSSSIPKKICTTFEEALSCHSNKCYTASAIMVRKTLEELCENQGATGNNLKAKIKSLGSKVTLPPPLIAGMDNLRLLGNDAAHLELKHFDNIGSKELEVAILLTTEVLKGVFQYEDLIRKLEGLKKTP